MVTRVLAVLCAVVPCGIAMGEGFISGSDGTDGDLIVAGNFVIDLGAAEFGPWDTTPGLGNGVYDPDLWAVVFKYSTIDVTSGTVTFINHPSGAPVVWLAQGSVFIGGTVNLDGTDGVGGGSPFQYQNPGPGGFAGGTAATGNFALSSGFGPGGGGPCGSDGSGSHATAGSGSAGHLYGTIDVQPLIGGSGGAGRGAGANIARGAGGGGAILIASSDAIEIAGSITARGGTGALVFGGDNDGWSASGGAIRLIANEILGSGSLTATGGGGFETTGGTGRIKLEAVNLVNFTGSSSPALFSSGPGPVFPAGAPILRAVMIGGVAVPADPDAGVTTIDVNVNQISVTLEIEAMNIPPGTTVRVYVRPAHGAACFFDSPPLMGDFGFSMTSIDLDLPEIQTEIQLKANF